MDPTIVGAIIVAIAGLLAALVELVGKLKRAKLEVQRLETERHERLIHPPTLEQFREVDTQLRELEEKLEPEKRSPDLLMLIAKARKPIGQLLGDSSRRTGTRAPESPEEG